MIPEGVTELADGQFMCCDSIEKVTIPQNMKKLSSGVFANCYDLKEVFFCGSESEWNSIYISEDYDQIKESEAVIHFAKDNASELGPIEPPKRPIGLLALPFTVWFWLAVGATVIAIAAAVTAVTVSSKRKKAERNKEDE